MTDEKTRALIAEAERRTREWSDPAEMPSDVKLIGSLANALSALTVPDRDARERLIEVLRTITPRLHEPLWTNVLGDQADAILAAFPVLSRASAGVAEREPSAHVNPVATSGERIKN